MAEIAPKKMCTRGPNRAPRRARHARHAVAPVAMLALFAGVAACEDDPFGLQNWESDPATALIYSLGLDDFNLVTAFDFTERARRPVEVRDEFGRFNNWDVALDTEDGELVLLPQGAFGIASEAAIIEIPNQDFDDVTEAPSDTTLYSSSEGLTLRTSSVYVVRTRRVVVQSFFTSQCVYYAKVKPLQVDPVGGVFEFFYDVNTGFSGCNNRALVPPT